MGRASRRRELSSPARPPVGTTVDGGVDLEGTVWSVGIQQTNVRLMIERGAC